MSAFKFRGFEFTYEGKTLKARPNYSADIHRGYPATFKTIAENIPSMDQAAKQAEDYASTNQIR